MGDGRLRRYGAGVVTIDSKNVEDGVDSTVSLLTGTVGVHYDLLPDSATTLRLKGDGTASRIAVAEKGPDRAVRRPG